MPADNEPDFLRILRRWVKETIVYNWTDFKLLVRNVIIVGVCTAILTHAWSIGWSRGLTWHIMYGISEAVPGPPGPVFIVPLGFFFGLASIFIFDSYKRLQGMLLVVPGIIIMLVIMIVNGRFSNPEVWRLITILIGFLSFLFGIAFGGLDEIIKSNGTYEMKQGFGRLITTVTLLSFLGILEATIDYPSPLIIDTGGDPTQSRIIPIKIPENIVNRMLTESSFATMPVLTPSPIPSGLYMIVVYFGVLAALVYSLRDLTKYERSKNGLILGPDRAGKTWFMSGSAYALQRRALKNVEFQNPEFNDAMVPKVSAFENEEFDSPVLRSNNRGEYDFFKFNFDHGFLPKRRVQLQTVDYAGEMLSEVDLNRPFTSFNQKWQEKNGVEPDELPDFDVISTFDKTVMSTSSQQNRDPETIYQNDIPPLISAMIDDCDSLGLIIPADEIAGGLNLDDDDLPDHLSVAGINNNLDKRVPARRINKGQNRYAYFELYREIIKTYGAEKDIFFIVTMSDIFLQTYRDQTEYQDPKGNPSWDRFRRHVYMQIEKQRTKVDFMSEALAANYDRYYPVYFEPKDPPGHTVPNTNKIRPYLEWDDEEYYLLRGLSEVLKRIGR